MSPIMIAALESAGRRLRHRGIAFQPLIDDVVIKLLAPKKARCGLPNNASLRFVECLYCDRAIEIVCFRDPGGKDLLERRSKWIHGGFPSPQTIAKKPYAQRGRVSVTRNEVRPSCRRLHD